MSTGTGIETPSEWAERIIRGYTTAEAVSSMEMCDPTGCNARAMRNAIAKIAVAKAKADAYDVARVALIDVRDSLDTAMSNRSITELREFVIQALSKME